ncbi:aldehyde dehydrogenase family protein [Streptomyces sp. S465]|uniref:aldehyde dehydrogenase family protein n=1 Tax=Streptomyces sp. S465 TaxID=2979468 RepID=UPI0022A8D028|nr:aldehyde dehydrogenase family protein [Streptomyces sp. S465]WAP60216.1 aldehyde dehydrogenase family protein [Streptomyces sp. S465]
METYPSLIDGADGEHDKWIHVVRTSAMLADEIGCLRLKRGLDRGTIDGVRDDRAVGRVGISSREQIDRAAAAARRAQREWADASVTDRIELGRRINEVMRKNIDRFIEYLVAEGHPRRFAELEIAVAMEGTSELGLELTRAQLEQIGHVGGRQTRLIRKPDGVVCVHPPHNAPAANSLLAIGALIAGNAVVVKAPRSAPLTTAWAWRELVYPALCDFGAPRGLVNVVCGEPNAVLRQWLDSDDTDNLMFFGDSARGIPVGRDWFNRGKKTVLELSGNDGVLIWRDAEVELAVEALREAYYGSGQVCMAPNFAVVHPDIADTVISRLADTVRTMRPGMPEDRTTVLSPVFKSAEFFQTLEQAVAGGAETLFGGHRIDVEGNVSDVGFFLEPTAIRVDGLALADRLDVVRKETFFPLLSIVVPERRDDDHALLRACVGFMNGNRYGLRNSLWSRDAHVIETFCGGMNNSGTLKVNDSHIGVSPGVATHGGTGLSGGPYGGANYPALGTSHLQAISIATEVRPRRAIFEVADGATPS